MLKMISNLILSLQWRNYHLYQRLANLKCWVKLLKTEIVDRKYYVGKGKIEEIQAFIEFKDIDVVITNDELTTAQSNH